MTTKLWMYEQCPQVAQESYVQSWHCEGPIRARARTAAQIARNTHLASGADKRVSLMQRANNFNFSIRQLGAGRRFADPSPVLAIFYKL